MFRFSVPLTLTFICFASSTSPSWRTRFGFYWQLFLFCLLPPWKEELAWRDAHIASLSGGALLVFRRSSCFHWLQARSAHLSPRALLRDGARVLCLRSCLSSWAAAFGTEKQSNRLGSHAFANTRHSAARCFPLFLHVFSFFFFSFFCEALHSSWWSCQDGVTGCCLACSFVFFTSLPQSKLLLETKLQ